MKRILPLIFLFCGCTIIPTQHGKAVFCGDYTNFNFTDGGVSLSCATMIHSGVVRAHWHGLIALGGEAASVLIPGGPVVKGAGVLGTAAVNRPTARATSAPTVITRVAQ